MTEPNEMDQITNLENGNPTCANCLCTIFMDDLGKGFYRCPVCGDELDARYPAFDPFDDYEDAWDDIIEPPEDDDYPNPEFQ